MLTHPRLTRAALALGLVALALGRPAAAQDDTALFSTAVPPNVMLMVDNSGSMNEVMWHPSFQPQLASSCPIFEELPPNDGSGPNDGDSGTLNSMPYVCAGYCRITIDNGTSGFTAVNSVSCPSGGTRPSGYITRTFCGNTRKLYVDGDTLCQGNRTWYSEEYLEWYFSDNADPYFLNSETNTSTDITKVDANRNGTHYVWGTQFPLYKRSRITAAKEIARDVIYQINSDCAPGSGFPCPTPKDVVRFGVARFDATSGAPGGFVSAPIDNYSTNATTLNNAIGALDAQTSTPLGETLFKLYTYFMSRTVADLPFGKNGTTRFPRYSYRTSDGANTTSPPADPLSCPPSNTKCTCQKNFVILITDGAPTNDDFSTSGTGNSNTTGRTLGFGDFTTRLIGDYNADGETENLGIDNGWLYLDDIAKFMQDKDFRPDMDGHQAIDVYTVGFATGTTANDLLTKTASVGNGLFFTGTQAQDLTDALVGAINSIILKSQSFTAATVPATRTSFGGKFYNSLFVPSQDDGYWEGYLQSWTITEAGEILDASGDCAFSGNPVPCFGGTFDPSATPHWNAATGVPAPASRNLYTSVLGAADKVAFNAANLDETHLGPLTAAEIPLYDYTSPSLPATSVGQLADMVVENVRGCEFGTGVGGVACQTRTNRAGAVHLLGDIFHSNPVVVGRPLGFLPEPSYQQWQSASTNPTIGLRQQVIMAGANDGFFRIFDAGTWDATPPPPTPAGYDAGTGAEIAGFMPYAARQNAKFLARDSGTRDYYFADGSPVAADVWLYDSPTASGPADKQPDEWATVVVSGMRQGGNEYFALDISNPAAADYPSYMWEFPLEDAGPSVTQWMGQSWSEPVITKVRVAVAGDYANPQERWVVIFGGGYDLTGDPNGSFYDLQATAGRSITMLDIKTGQILAQKHFDPTGVPAGDDPTAVTYDASNPERSMVFAIASTPGVYDIDSDGFADVVYVGDLGGNLWKWVIEDVGDDVVNGATGTASQDRWHFEKFFAAPVHTHSVTGAKHYRSFYFYPSATLKSGVLWLAFGSGERADLKFAGYPSPEDENNRFYAVKDLDPHEESPPTAVMGESNLYDITSVLGGATDVSSFDGLMFKGTDGEKFVTATDIFFYYVFVASFTPATSSDPCSAGGSATLYAFKIYSGEGLFEDGSGNPVATIDLGDGMPTDPKVSLSGAEGGSRVFINKKDEVLSHDPGFTLDKTFGQATWEEVYE